LQAEVQKPKLSKEERTLKKIDHAVTLVKGVVNYERKALQELKKFKITLTE